MERPHSAAARPACNSACHKLPASTCRCASKGVSKNASTTRALGGNAPRGSTSNAPMNAIAWLSATSHSLIAGSDSRRQAWQSSNHAGQQLLQYGQSGRSTDGDVDGQHQELGSKGNVLILDLNDRLQHAHGDTDETHGHDDRSAQKKRCAECHIHQAELCCAQWNEPINAPTTRAQPSATTKSKSFSGKAMVAGGTMNMPSDISAVATTRSMTTKGSARANPIAKAVRSSPTKNAGAKTEKGGFAREIGTRAARANVTISAVRVWRAMKASSGAPARSSAALGVI